MSMWVLGRHPPQKGLSPKWNILVLGYFVGSQENILRTVTEVERCHDCQTGVWKSWM